MSKYKIGDVVTVKTWEEMAKIIFHMEREYGLIYYPEIGECISMPNYVFVDDMKKFCNKNVTITEVLSDCYRIKEDKGTYGWTDLMFK